jgi:hypothetical protein
MYIGTKGTNFLDMDLSPALGAYMFMMKTSVQQIVNSCMEISSVMSVSPNSGH